MRERPLSSVPKPALLLLALGLCLQVAWHALVPARRGGVENLSRPPALATLRLSALGESIALSKLLMFHVQAQDSQLGRAGINQLDYASLEQWLSRISDLDPRAQYPLLAASTVYGEVGDPGKQRQMAEFVYRRFLDDPNRRWPSLAHAAVVAKHRLHDMPLALRYARALRERATAPNVPHWAKQMEIFLLEDMNELESAKVMLGGLLASGQITDPKEQRFLLGRLKAMSAASAPK